MQEPMTVFFFFSSKGALASLDSLWNTDKFKEVSKFLQGSQNIGYIS